MSEPLAPVIRAGWLALIGNIDNAAFGRLAIHVNSAAAAGITDMHMLIQSSGGIINDAFAAYNLLRSAPFTVHTYNIGFVGSAATIVYLAGKRRVCEPTGAFLLHRPASNSGGNRPAIDSNSESLALDDARCHAVMKERLALTTRQLAVYKARDLWLDSKTALAAQLASELGSFAPKGGFFIV